MCSVCAITLGVCVFRLFFFLAAQFDFSITFQPHKWVPCTIHRIYKPYFLANFFIKNGSQDTIYTFKNYFIIVFSVFSCIQIDPIQIWLFNHFSATQVGPVYCLRNLQTLLFSNFFIKNGSHNTIYTFKNYFTIVFSVFNCIQIDPQELYYKYPVRIKINKKYHKEFTVTHNGSRNKKYTC